MMTGEAEEFWRFSCDVYARPGVEAALLELQDQDGLDVSSLLFCLHAAACGKAVNESLGAAMAAVGEAWGAGIVAPLRAARRALKRVAPESVLRAEVKQLELEAERALHAALEALLPEALPAQGDVRALAERNLAAWLACRNLTVTERRRAGFAVLIAQAFA